MEISYDFFQRTFKNPSRWFNKMFWLKFSLGMLKTLVRLIEKDKKNRPFKSSSFPPLAPTPVLKSRLKNEVTNTIHVRGYDDTAIITMVTCTGHSNFWRFIQSYSQVWVTLSLALLGAAFMIIKCYTGILDNTKTTTN